MSDKIEVNPTFESVLEEVSKEFAVPRSVARNNKTCVMCGGDASVFRDAVSTKEYTLSGMCQGCQDEIFGEPEC